MGKAISILVGLIVWITGVLVSLAVGFGMISKNLAIPYVQPIVPIAGWIVIILTIMGVILAIANRY